MHIGCDSHSVYQMLKSAGVVKEEMIEITHFNPALAKYLPETNTLLLDAGLCVHDAIDRITMHGSRGPQGGARPNSDIDLCLVVNDRSLGIASDRKALLREILSTTLKGWRGKTELDLAAVFDKHQCELRCLSLDEFDPDLCSSTVDCMGLFKIQKGFNGFVSGPTVDCSKMYPLMTIWNRKENTAQQSVAGDV